jgi:hypothetical protein
LQSANIVMTTPVSNVCLLVSHRDHVFWRQN